LSSLKLDLHAIFNDSKSIERALNDILEEAIEKRIPTIEIIPGKGSGQLKKRVLRFFEQPEKKKLYHRLQKDSKNFGRIFIHLKF
jgi:DNA-nicking Smr family endonuclease